MGGAGVFKKLAVCIALAGVSVLAFVAPSVAATWEVQKLPFQPRYEGDRAMFSLLGISCPSSSFCLTAGLYGQIGVSTNPTGGSAAWNVYLGPRAFDSGKPPPGLPPPSPSITGVSCPAPGLCVAVTRNGDIYTSPDPLGGHSNWTRTDIDGDGAETHLEGISCPTVSFCVAVSGGRPQRNNPRTSGKVLTSRDPAGGASAWQIHQLDPSLDLRGVSCASPSLCVAVAREGRILVSSDPAGGPSAWRDAGAPGGPGDLQGIACVAGLCVAGNAGGNLLTATDPIGRPGAWTERNGGGSVPITGISCPSATQCVAVDNNGDVLTSSDPTGGRSAWSFENVLPYVPQADGYPVPNGMFAVSCPSPSFCAIAAADGRVVTSTDPFSGTGQEAGKRKMRSRHPKRPRTILAHVDNRRFSTAKPRLRMRFRFYAKSKTRSFLCKLDRRPYRRCKSPTHRRVGVGRHIFRVRAIGPTGLRGPVAAESFRIFPADSRCPCVVRPVEPAKPVVR